MSNVNPIPVITIDGPGGSGKGTVGLLLANALGWHFLDSGALYRVLALSTLNEGVAEPFDEKKLEKLAIELPVSFNGDVCLEGKRVNDLIRSETCGNIASKIAIYPGVRAALLERQRAFRKLPGLVADGRDMGTVVFQDAFLKIFLEASAEERARRRYLQLKNGLQDVTLQNLLQEIQDRDLRDKQRAVAPLMPAKDAVVVDTTGMGIEDVLAKVMTEVKKHLSNI